MDNITLGQIVGGLAIITAIIVFVQKVITPIKNFTSRIDKLEEHQKNDNQRLQLLEQDTKMILKSINVLILHEETGNESGEMKKIKKELDDYIIGR